MKLITDRVSIPQGSDFNDLMSAYIALDAVVSIPQGSDFNSASTPLRTHCAGVSIPQGSDFNPERFFSELKAKIRFNPTRV